MHFFSSKSGSLATYRYCYPSYVIFKSSKILLLWKGSRSGFLAMIYYGVSLKFNHKVIVDYINKISIYSKGVTDNISSEETTISVDSSTTKYAGIDTQTTATTDTFTPQLEDELLYDDTDDIANDFEAFSTSTNKINELADESTTFEKGICDF